MFRAEGTSWAKTVCWSEDGVQEAAPGHAGLVPGMGKGQGRPLIKQDEGSGP